jgi:hypothetical protein
MRFITNLLTLLQHAPSLRRVVCVGGGGNEGPLDLTDFPALRVPKSVLRGHLITLITLGLEAVSRTAPDVSFVHDYPGTVNTTLFRRMKGLVGVLMRAYVWLLGPWICVPVEECGERHVYLSTSARYPPLKAGSAAVTLGDGLAVAFGTNGEVGSGVYSVGWDCESASNAVRELLAGLRQNGIVDVVWRRTESEFKRITGLERGL